MKEIKILQILPQIGKDGISSFVLNYSQALKSKHVSMDFICMRVLSQEALTLIHNSGGEVLVIPLLSPFRFFANIIHILIFFYKNSKKYDIVHVHHLGAGFIYLFIAWLFHIPKRIAHSHSVVYSFNKYNVIPHKICTQFFIFFATDYWGCSDAAGLFMFGKKRWAQKGCVIKNAINPEKYAFSEKKRNNLRKKLDLPINCSIILSVGSVNIGKNPFFTIDVFSEYARLVPQAVLLFCGKNYLGNSLMQYASHKNVQDKTFVLGERSDVGDFYSASDVLLFPSLAEGLGFVAVEAQAAGLPCLVSDKVPREAIFLDNTAQYSLCKTPLEWAVKIKELVQQGRCYNVDDRIKCAGYNIESYSDFLYNSYLGI